MFSSDHCSLSVWFRRNNFLDKPYKAIPFKIKWVCFVLLPLCLVFLFSLLPSTFLFVFIPLTWSWFVNGQQRDLNNLIIPLIFWLKNKFQCNEHFFHIKPSHVIKLTNWTECCQWTWFVDASTWRVFCVSTVYWT